MYLYEMLVGGRAVTFGTTVAGANTYGGYVDATNEGATRGALLGLYNGTRGPSRWRASSPCSKRTSCGSRCRL